MGLYISVKILENHFNGYIFCENEIDDYGMGACFTVKIPIYYNNSLQDS